MRRRDLLAYGSAALAVGLPVPVAAATDPRDPLLGWYRLALELVRHTPTFSPPVASRAFAYLGITAYQSLDLGGAMSLAGQLTGLEPLPPRPPGLDPALTTHAALAVVVQSLFSHTGPSGQRAIKAVDRQQTADLSATIAPDVAALSLAHGTAVAGHILNWAATDGGDVIDNMGFPRSYALNPGPGHWVPTSLIVQQQAPLLPRWGENRRFVTPLGSCTLPPPPAYSEEPGSEFYAQALEVCEVRKTLTDEQKAIAGFWSDDAMLSTTPPGHWVTIALGVIERENLDASRAADVLARLGMAVADGFIACWASKYDHDLLRPVTYIKRLIDKTWEPLLITPPFPEYPSGHSTQSSAAAEVLTALFGDGYGFEDDSHADDGLPPRHFASFRAAAQEAAMSRLYGGIHFRAAIDQGLIQGACVATHVNALKTLG